MPFYPFRNPKTQEVAEIFFHMNDEKRFIDEDGLEWKREWLAPNFSVDNKINPWSKNDFIEKTANKVGTLGDLWDKSEELSKKRAQENNGVDPLKQKHFKDYRKKRKGVKHPLDNS